MAHHPVLGTTRILVVDDEPDLRTLYELTLLREGYLVDAAATVQEAQALLGQQSFDLVITDMRLPDGTGIDLLKVVRAQQRRERCIVITAYGSAENAVESLKAGAFDYLTKPVDLKQFRGVVAAALQGAPASGGAFSSSRSAPWKPSFHAAKWETRRWPAWQATPWPCEPCGSASSRSHAAWHRS